MISSLLRCKEIFNGHILVNTRVVVVDNTNYTVMSTSDELSGIKDSQF